MSISNKANTDNVVDFQYVSRSKIAALQGEVTASIVDTARYMQSGMEMLVHANELLSKSLDLQIKLQKAQSLFNRSADNEDRY